MEQDRRNSGGLSKPGPNIVRAWFDTVVNPLLSALDMEQQYLERKNWSWNHWRGKLESVLPVVEHLGKSMEPNLVQFYEFHPDVRTLADEHDRGVQTLWEQCIVLQTLLQSNEDLRLLYAKATSSEALEQLRGRGQKIDDDMSEEEDLPVFAEYVINNRSSLPSYYTTSGVWNMWRDQFLALQQLPSVEPLYNVALVVGEKLLNQTQNLVKLLVERRKDLSIKYDVPIVLWNEAA